MSRETKAYIRGFERGLYFRMDIPPDPAPADVERDLDVERQRTALLTLENRWLGHLGTCYQCFHYAYGNPNHPGSRCEDGEARYQLYITAEKDRMKEGVAHEIHPVP